MTLPAHGGARVGSATASPAGSIDFIGNATVLIRFAGFTILTDPNFVPRGEEIPLGYGLTTTRITDPSMPIDALPALDLVVLSHFHADHFDRVAEDRLDRSLPIITTPEAAAKLADLRFGATRALETWESWESTRDGGRLRVTAMPGRHAPAALTIALPEVMGSMLELWHGADVDGSGGPSGDPSGADRSPDLRLYISGDTLMYAGLREINTRYPEIDLALLHLGGTRVMGLTVTMDAEQGVELLQALEPRLAIPIHYNDYEAFKSPLKDFVAGVRAAGLKERVRYLLHGERFELAELRSVR